MDHGFQHIPKFSVILTAYNGGRFIATTLEALLGQTLKDFELIVIDDCSLDDTVKIISEYKDPRIRLVRNQENQGISRSRNLGINLARGEYMAMSDHDDISLPTRLEKQAAFLDAHPDHIMVAARSIIQASESQRHSKAIVNPYLLHWTLFYRCPLVHSSICVRREPVQRAGIAYIQEYAYAEDYQIYHQLGRVGKLGMLDEPLVLYIIHDQNTTHSVLEAMNRNGLAFLREQYRDYLGLREREEDVGLVWKLCNLKIPTDKAADLERLGKFLALACERFIEIQQPDIQDSALLWENVGATWWHVVRMCAENFGKPSLLAIAESNIHPKIKPPVLAWRVLSRYKAGLRGIYNYSRNKLPYSR